MTYKFILLPLITGLFLFAATPSFAQNAPTKEEQKQAQEFDKEKAIRDELRLQATKDLKAQTKADAKRAEAKANEAKRIDKEASYAAKQAKRAARMEAKAQHNRIEADKQANKAAKAATKSNKN
ncbi:hypothetical protein [Pontibacter fetidus]|uniref:Uncharacterized protein n=1 Tax=Pontibacter fetidus TaxID=2700082 RepID=A0A6B2H730_9BACT|nr:hypothetical protein [Pontibacter fetidus]NDK55720.1 hypothetical protein [Pontibacter fetidus]